MASINRTLALALRVVRQFVRDRRTMALLFLAPLLVMTLLNFVLNSSSAKITLAIVPPPGPQGDALGSAIQTAFDGQKGIHTKIIAAGDADSTLKNGDADAVVRFPDDFFTTLAIGGQARVDLRLEGSNPTVADQAKQLASFAIARASAELAQRAPGGLGGPTPSLALDTSYLYGGPQYTQTDALAPLFIGLFSFFFVFLLSCVAFIRERGQGTLERLMVSPLSQTELTLGYVIGLTLFAMIQSIVILAFVIYVLKVHYAGSLWLLFVVTFLLTLGAVNMGIFASAYARNEFQVIQFVPLLLVPQALLGGLFFAVSTLPVVLKQLAYIMPLTWANFALQDVMLKGLGFDHVWPDLVFLAGFAILMVFASALSLRQERI